MPQQQICRYSLGAELKSLGRGLTGQRKLPLQVVGLHWASPCFCHSGLIQNNGIHFYLSLVYSFCTTAVPAALRPLPLFTLGFFLWARSDLHTFGLKGWMQWRTLCFHSELSFISFFLLLQHPKVGRGQKVLVSSPSSSASAYHDICNKTKKKFRWQTGNKTSSHLGNVQPDKLRTWREIHRKYNQLGSL